MSFHLFHINELYSNASGTVQYIEFVGEADDQNLWAGHSMTSTDGLTTHTKNDFTNLPGTLTAGKSVLVATQGFADLGLVTPDYIIPNGFLFTGGGTVNFIGMDTLVHGALPVNGTSSLNSAGASGTNSPANFAGVSGTIPGNPIPGTAGADNLLGTTANDYMVGLGGNDTLSGGLGNDTMVGGLGNDTYIRNAVGDVVTEAAGAGTDTVQSAVTYTLGLNVENLTLTGAAAINGTGNTLNNVITGNTANNILNGGSGNDTLNGGLGNDTMAGGLGNDTYVRNAVGDVVTEGVNAGTDTVQSAVTYTLGANVENLTLTGAGIINGTGNTLANILTGNAANNTLNGGAGNDTMAGGLGNDIYVRNVAGDVVTEAVSAGTDTVQSAVTYTLGLNVENLTLTGAGAINGTGNTLANVLTGNTANNILNGGTGNDTLNGGLGNDTYVVDVATDVVTEGVNAGTDTVQSAVTWTLGLNVENLTLTGAGAINGTGNTAANVITGNTANNILNGSGGNDTMAGGLGNDTYVVDVATDVVTEAASAGTDTVQSAVTYTLGANVENLTLTGAGAINGTGNTAANVITGNTANNILNGSGGNDTMAGGLGNDTYVVDVATDVVTEAASAGTDTVQSAVTYTLGLNVENLTLTGVAAINGTGNTLDNVLTGNTANNTLNGSTGNDTLNGGLGNDTYVVNVATDVVTEAASAGTDTVQSAVTYTLGLNVENLTLTGVAAINGTGNTLDNVLTGNTANNILNGSTGNDTMAGGLGNDTYVVNVATDVVTEAASAGTDTVQSAVTWTLGLNVENLTLTGAAAVNGIGNTLANVLTGNTANNILTGGDGNDTLNGGLGNDTLAGGLGNDTYVVNAATDVVTEAASAGTDTVQSAVTWTLGTNVERLTLTGATAIDGTGNTLANVLTGNTGNNILTAGDGNDTLNGGLGNDTMAGGIGNDNYVIDTTSDAVTELVNEGVDTVSSSVTYTLGDHVDNLTLTGTGNLNGAGNALSNAINGTSGDNTLTGGTGNDTLNGGLGNDDLIGDTLGAGPVGDGLTPTAEAYLNSAGNSLVDALGGTQGFGEGTLAANDDNSSAAIDITSIFGLAGLNFFGSQYQSLYVNNNGNITFSDPLVQFTPSVINAGVANPVIAPFWADVDTSLSIPPVTVVPTPGGTSGGSNLVYYDLDAVNGVFTVTWDDVGYYSSKTDKLNAFQLQLVDRGSGDFDMIFRYEAVNWTTGSSISSGGVNGLGGAVARGGYSAGDGSSNYFELAQSGDGPSMLSLDTTTGNSGRTGVYIFNVRSGSVQAVGDDLLDGGAGADTMRGGLGNDTYVVDNASDNVVEDVNPGIDAVQAAISYTLGLNLENLTLTGVGVINGTGNALNNVITGNTAANILDGGAGADTLNGGDGNDTMVWSAADMSINGGVGTDTLRVDGGTALNLTTVLDTMILNVETINLAGANTLTLALADVLAISSSTDLLTVDGAADDTVHRGAGWAQGADQGGYHAYTQGLATLLVDADINSVV